MAKVAGWKDNALDTVDARLKGFICTAPAFNGALIMSLMGSEITLINSLFKTSAHKNERIPPAKLEEQQPETKGTEQGNKTVN